MGRGGPVSAMSMPGTAAQDARRRVAEGVGEGGVTHQRHGEPHRRHGARSRRRVQRDSAGSKIAATPAIITEHALRLAGTVWEEAVRNATAEHAIIEKAWRDEKAHKDGEINELATDLDTATSTHQETVKELRTQVEEANQAARGNAAAAVEAHDQLTVAARNHADEVAELKSHLAEARATITTLQQTQEALIARIQPTQEAKPVPGDSNSQKG